MGASNSKNEPVYVYASQVPIGFTAQLKDKLVSEATTTPNPPAAAAAAGAMANSRDLADKVDEGVAKELARILEKNQLEELKAKERQASTSDLLREIRDVSHQIASNPTTKSPTYELALHARDRVAACLKDNAGRTLDCWKDVCEFKSLVATLESDITASIDFDTDDCIRCTIIDYDRVLVLDKGKVAEFDTPWNLLQSKGGIFRSMCEKSGEYEHLVATAQCK
ncbi:hypothetical protein GGH93_005861, partial [Coemansia aciculifera]